MSPTGSLAGEPGPESCNSLFKWELIYPQGPWRGLDVVEFATLGYIDWFNHRRLHGEITDDNHYTTPSSSRPSTTVKKHPPSRRSLNSPSSHQTRGHSHRVNS
jgi:putative transposase